MFLSPVISETMIVLQRGGVCVGLNNCNLNFRNPPIIRYEPPGPVMTE